MGASEVEQLSKKFFFILYCVIVRSFICFMFLNKSDRFKLVYTWFIFFLLTECYCQLFKTFQLHTWKLKKKHRSRLLRHYENYSGLTQLAIIWPLSGPFFRETSCKYGVQLCVLSCENKFEVSYDFVPTSNSKTTSSTYCLPKLSLESNSSNNFTLDVFVLHLTTQKNSLPLTFYQPLHHV